MHWTERTRAVAAIGEELQRRGWTLYGYTPDHSDPMTDYYAPADWRGVAAKGDVVVCVDISSYDARYSGQDIVEYTAAPGETCAHCQGTGIWPGGLTYEEAKVDPAGQHFILYCAEQGGRPGYPDVVSPLHYHGVGPGEAVNPAAPYGAPRCLYCGGRGHQLRSELRSESTVVGRWPTFRANPKGKTWHVQRGGRIVDSGVGLQGCADYDHAKRAAAVRALCDRIERAAHTQPHIEAPGSVSPTGTSANAARPQKVITRGVIEGDIACTVYEEGIAAEAWTWIRFSGKPSEACRERLKRAGGRWGKQRQEWYFKYVPVDLAALGLAEPPAPAADEPPPAPAETPDDPPPWTMTRRAYQEGKALTVAGGVPILNGQDGRDHAAAVREAVVAGLPVPAYVLADYPDLADRGPAEVAPPDEGAPAVPDEPGPIAGSGPATPAAVEPAPDAGDYRLAELGCPGCGLTFHGMVGSATAVPDPARCPRCGTLGIALDEDDPPARRDPDGYYWVELHCQPCDLLFQGLLGPQVTKWLIRCPGCWRSHNTIRPLDMPAAWLGHGAALTALMQRLADDETLRARMQNAPERAYLAFERRVDEVLPELVDTHWEFYRLTAEQPAVMADLLAQLFRWYYPLAAADGAAARPIAADDGLTAADVAVAGQLAGAADPDPLGRLLTEMEELSPQPAEAPAEEPAPDPLDRLLGDAAVEPPAPAGLPARPGLPWAPTSVYQVPPAAPAPSLVVAVQPVLTPTGQLAMFEW